MLSWPALLAQSDAARCRDLLLRHEVASVWSHTEYMQCRMRGTQFRALQGTGEGRRSGRDRPGHPRSVGVVMKRGLSCRPRQAGRGRCPSMPSADRRPPLRQIVQWNIGHKWRGRRCFPIRGFLFCQSGDSVLYRHPQWARWPSGGPTLARIEHLLAASSGWQGRVAPRGSAGAMVTSVVERAAAGALKIIAAVAAQGTTEQQGAVSA